jgi:hypothetical protein
MFGESIREMRHLKRAHLPILTEEKMGKRKVSRPWDNGIAQWHIDLSDVGFNAHVDMTGDQVRKVISRLNPDRRALLEEAVRTQDPALLEKARKILAAAILESQMTGK